MKIGTGHIVDGTGRSAARLAYVVWEPAEWLAAPGSVTVAGRRRGTTTAIRKPERIKGHDPDPAAFARYVERNGRLLDGGEGGIVVLSSHPFTSGYPAPPVWAVAFMAAHARGRWIAVDHTVVVAEIDSEVRPGATVCRGPEHSYRPSR